MLYSLCQLSVLCSSELEHLERSGSEQLHTTISSLDSLKRFSNYSIAKQTLSAFFYSLPLECGKLCFSSF